MGTDSENPIREISVLCHDSRGIYPVAAAPARGYGLSMTSSHLRLASSIGETETAPLSISRLPIRVVLADDHALLRRTLQLLLDGEDDVEVIAQARDLEEVGRYVHEHHPSVLVLDLGMPDGSSIEKVGELREQAPDTQIVVLTMADNPVFAQRAFANGALGFVSKDLADSELAEAVRAASQGERYISPRVARRLDALNASLTDNKLTARETEVLEYIALGYTSVEIARKLKLSPRTVETHRAHIHKKLGLASRAELVRYALRRGLVRD